MFRTHKLIVATAATLALTAPAAVAQQDLRSPDARDASVAVPQDLRSPDARDASVVVPQDLRSPDARDASFRPATPTPDVPSPVRVVEPSGFQWGDAGIGAAGMLGIVLALGAIGVLLSQHRRRSPFVAH